MHIFSRSKVALFFSLVAFGAMLGVLLVNTVVPSLSSQAASPTLATKKFEFKLVASPGIQTNCLPHARGEATIVRDKLNDQLTVEVNGLAPNTGYDLFVIELPNKPFGVSWYQSDVETNGQGEGSVSVRGIFNVETFSVSLGEATPTATQVVFPPTHQFHIGLWFNDPKVPFKLGCEPGATAPVITPFNGEQHAGIQVLNTSNFPDNAGPLSHVAP